MSISNEAREMKLVRVSGGHVVQTPGEARPYKVVLNYEHTQSTSEHPVDTMREGEALIRHRSPRPDKVSRLREFSAPM